MQEVNEYILKKINLPRRLWHCTPKTLKPELRETVEPYLREWVGKWSQTGSQRDHIWMFGDDAHDLFSVTIQAVARRGIDIYCFHPAEIDVILDRNPNMKNEWYDMPLLGIYAYFENTGYDWKTRNFLHQLVKHRWFNNRTTIVSTGTKKMDTVPSLVDAQIIKGFIEEAFFIETY